MSESIKHWLLASDIDGTLIDANGIIPKPNLDAVARFTDNGGYFALATGRSVLSGKRYVERIPGCRYAILCNGSMIYDYTEDNVVYEKNLPTEAFRLAERLYDRFDTLCIEVYTDNGVFCVRRNFKSKEHLDYEGLSYTDCELSELPRDGWIKTVLVDEPDKMTEMRPLIKEMVDFNAELAISDPPFYEVIPENCTKGTALRVLATHLSIPIERTAAIGDYYNDIELLKAAGMTGVPKHAPSEILAMADHICVACEDGAVADFIEYLDRMD